MTMHISLSPEMEGFIKGKVIRDAIRRMQAEEARVAAWQVAVQKGDEQLDSITQNAIGAMYSRQPMDPDVRP